MIFSLVLLQTAFISWDDRYWFERVDLRLYKYLGLERSKVWWKMGIKEMGNNKYHNVAIRHWIWNHLLLLVRGNWYKFLFQLHLTYKHFTVCWLPIFCISRFSFALWPIWSFLTIPLLVYQQFCFPFTVFYYFCCFILCQKLKLW